MRQRAVLRACDRTPATQTTAGDLDFCGVPTLGQNRTVLGQLIGASNYDVGHIALGVNGGGVAYLGVVGGDYKGGGCTGLPEPKGDFFAIDYVAHEIGHQFGGNHTFNGALGACGGNISERLGRAGLRLVGDGLRRHLRPGRPPAAHRPLLLLPDRRRGRRRPWTRRRTATSRCRRSRCAGFDTTATPSPCGFDGRPPTRSPSAPTTRRPASRRPSRRSPAGRRLDRRSGASTSSTPTTVDYVPPVAPDETGFQVIFNDGPTVFRPTAATSTSRTSRSPTSAGVDRLRRRDRPGRPASTTASVLPDRTAATRQRRPVGDRAGRQDDPDPHAVRADRLGHRRRRRRPRLPVGADQLRRRGTRLPTTPRSTARCSGSSATTPSSATRTR